MKKGRVNFMMDWELISKIDAEIKKKKKLKTGYSRTDFFKDLVEQHFGITVEEEVHQVSKKASGYTVEDLTFNLVVGNVYSMNEIARRSGISRTTVKKILENGEIDFYFVPTTMGPYAQYECVGKVKSTKPKEEVKQPEVKPEPIAAKVVEPEPEPDRYEMDMEEVVAEINRIKNTPYPELNETDQREAYDLRHKKEMEEKDQFYFAKEKRNPGAMNLDKSNKLYRLGNITDQEKMIYVANKFYFEDKKESVNQLNRVVDYPDAPYKENVLIKYVDHPDWKKVARKINRALKNN